MFKVVKTWMSECRDFNYRMNLIRGLRKSLHVDDMNGYSMHIQLTLLWHNIKISGYVIERNK